MTLEEAIMHSKEIAMKECGEWAKDHAQLAKWLEELQQYRAKSPITERVKTFEDACREVGEDPGEFEKRYGGLPSADLAYLKLATICEALNEGWKPQFTEGKDAWYPKHFLYTQKELDEKDEEWRRRNTLIDTGDYLTEYVGFAYTCTHSTSFSTEANQGSRLCLKSKELSDYCGTQFVNLWADFKLVRK